MEGEFEGEFAFLERQLWQLLNQVPMTFNSIGKNSVDESWPIRDCASLDEVGFAVQRTLKGRAKQHVSASCVGFIVLPLQPDTVVNRHGSG